MISPGNIITPILVNAAGMTQEQSDAFWATEGPKAPAGRAGKPEEFAAAALFLASDESSFVTGIDFPVDGGVAQV
jgi:NAD(P)-dependent dehydrogenase (short-subunit alcohol dehydrogenase family)